MATTVLRPSVEIGAGVMPGTIEDPDIRLRKVRRKPFGAYQRFRICIGHLEMISMSESRQSRQRDICPAVQHHVVGIG
jgi:hypothetical protein